MPNRDWYVRGVKLRDEPTYVDDITANTPVAEMTVNQDAIDTIERRLGVAANHIVEVVGADQLASMELVVAQRRVVCVNRPGLSDELTERVHEVMREPRYLDAEKGGRCIVVDLLLLGRALAVFSDFRNW